MEKLLPLMFSLNKQNYSRYGSGYVNTLENLDDTDPGCRELIQDKGLSVQGQEKYLCRTAIDQRGEQTINRDAKTSGGIKYFATDPNAIVKWTLNRSTQAKIRIQKHCTSLQTSEALSSSTNLFDHLI